MPVTLSDGRRVDVLFSGGVNMDTGAVYSTSNAELQDILDNMCKSPYCDFYLESVSGQEDITPVEILDSREFNNLVELRNALKEKGIDVTGLTTVQRAETLAKKNGYLYTIKKN